MRFALALSLLLLMSVGRADPPGSEPRAWSFDSLVQKHSEPGSPSPTDEQQIVALLGRMTERWNAHDVEGYMEVFWRSPDLCYVCNGQEVMGWGNLMAEYQRGFPDRNTMGTVHVDRTLVQVIDANVASALDWWSVSFPTKSSHPEFATTTYLLRKFPAEGWKIVLLHTSFVEP
ncbi:MAG TPA: hypothetical protein VHY59_07175 [Chthoniobacterales bacterium]|nr:hypothetical protein [Chthoniobacterales bacterium]